MGRDKKSRATSAQAAASLIPSHLLSSAAAPSFASITNSVLSHARETPGESVTLEPWESSVLTLLTRASSKRDVTTVLKALQDALSLFESSSTRSPPSTYPTTAHPVPAAIAAGLRRCVVVRPKDAPCGGAVAMAYMELARACVRWYRKGAQGVVTDMVPAWLGARGEVEPEVRAAAISTFEEAIEKEETRVRVVKKVWKAIARVAVQAMESRELERIRAGVEGVAAAVQMGAVTEWNEQLGELLRAGNNAKSKANENWRLYLRLLAVLCTVRMVPSDVIDLVFIPESLAAMRDPGVSAEAWELTLSMLRGDSIASLGDQYHGKLLKAVCGAIRRGTSYEALLPLMAIWVDQGRNRCVDDMRSELVAVVLGRSPAVEALAALVECGQFAIKHKFMADGWFQTALSSICVTGYVKNKFSLSLTGRAVVEQTTAEVSDAIVGAAMAGETYLRDLTQSIANACFEDEESFRVRCGRVKALLPHLGGLSSPEGIKSAKMLVEAISTALKSNVNLGRNQHVQGLLVGVLDFDESCLGSEASTIASQCFKEVIASGEQSLEEPFLLLASLPKKSAQSAILSQLEHTSLQQLRCLSEAFNTKNRILSHPSFDSYILERLDEHGLNFQRDLVKLIWGMPFGLHLEQSTKKSVLDFLEHDSTFPATLACALLENEDPEISTLELSIIVRDLIARAEKLGDDDDGGSLDRLFEAIDLVDDEETLRSTRDTAISAVERHGGNCDTGALAERLVQLREHLDIPLESSWNKTVIGAVLGQLKGRLDDFMGTFCPPSVFAQLLEPSPDTEISKFAEDVFFRMENCDEYLLSLFAESKRPKLNDFLLSIMSSFRQGLLDIFQFERLVTASFLVSGSEGVGLVARSLTKGGEDIQMLSSLISVCHKRNLIARELEDRLGSLLEHLISCDSSSEVRQIRGALWPVLGCRTTILPTTRELLMEASTSFILEQAKISHLPTEGSALPDIVATVVEPAVYNSEVIADNVFQRCSTLSQRMLDQVANNRPSAGLEYVCSACNLAFSLLEKRQGDDIPALRNALRSKAVDASVTSLPFLADQLRRGGFQKAIVSDGLERILEQDGICEHSSIPKYSDAERWSILHGLPYCTSDEKLEKGLWDVLQRAGPPLHFNIATEEEDDAEDLKTVRDWLPPELTRAMKFPIQGAPQEAQLLYFWAWNYFVTSVSDRGSEEFRRTGLRLLVLCPAVVEELLSKCCQYIMDSATPKKLSHVATECFTLCLKSLPGLCRRWFCDFVPRAVSRSLEDVVRKSFSPSIISSEITHMKGLALSDSDGEGELKVQGSTTAREVRAAYDFSDVRIEITLRLPDSYPLKQVEVIADRRVGMSEARWRKTILGITKLVTVQNGSLAQAVQMWRRNLDKSFRGVEECPICYSVLHLSTGAMPKLKCRTCNSKFHSACLCKWFSTSNSSTCPMCRSTF